MKKSTHPHVVYIITKLELGGAQKICLSLFKGLQEKSPAYCSLISGSYGILVEDIKEFESVYLLDSLQREVGWSPKKLIQEVKTFFTIIKTLKEIKKNFSNVIVHTHSTKAGILGRWAAFFSGIPTRIHTIHGYGFHDHQNWIAWMMIYMLEYVTSLVTTHFICVSEQDQSTGTRFFPKFKEKSSLIRAAVHDEKFYPVLATNATLSDQSDIIIGTISCFKPQKNLIDLLKAFHFIFHQAPVTLRKRLRLQIIGDGILRSKLEALILHNHLNTHIDLLGWQDNVASWMQTWKVFALSSLWEGLPCATIEARLCKIPVVAYSVGGISEVISNEKNGFLVQPGDWKRLGERIMHIICSEEQFTTMSQHNDQLEPFRNVSMIKQHIKLYDNFVAHHESIS